MKRRKIKLPVNAVYAAVILLVIIAQACLTAAVTVAAVEHALSPYTIEFTTTSGEYPQWFVEWRNTEYYGEEE